MKLDDMEKGLVALTDGIWVGNLPQAFLAGVRLKVRRLWNPEYQALYGELTAAYERDAEGTLLITPEEEAKVTDECLKRTVLVDWEGIDDPYSPKAADRVLANPTLRPIFRGAIILAATKAVETYTASLKADEKN